MQLSYTPYIIPLVIAGAVSAWVAYYAWSHRAVSGASALAFLALAVSDWTIAYAFEIGGADLPTKVFWAKIEYIGTITIPLLWMVFCYNYFNQNRQLQARVIAGLGVLPIITLLLVFTTEYHGLIWTRYYITQADGFSTLGVDHGFWFWVYWIYAYILLMVGTYFIVRGIRHKHGLYRRQIAALIVAVIAPWVGNFLYVSGLTPIENLDLTPFGFTVAVMSVSWAIFRFQLINLLPIARDAVLEEMEDGILVIDVPGQVVDVNRAAATMIGLSMDQILGKRVADVFQQWPHLTKKYRDALDMFDEVAIGEGETQRWFELRFSPLRDKYESVIGKLVLFRDITVKRQADERLRQLSRAVEASPASIVITDASGYIQYVNPKFTEVTGYGLQEVLGKSPRILKTDQTPPEIHAQLWNTIAAGREWHGEFCNRKKNGELYWETASISPIFDSNGSITNFVAVKEDITEQRRIQEQLKLQNKYLSILHEITLDLLNRRDLDDLLRAIVNHAADLLDAPYGEILLAEGESLVVYSFTENQNFLLEGRADRNAGKLAWQAYVTGQPAIVNDYSTWPEHHPLYDQLALHAVAEFPVMIGNRCAAVIGMGRSKPGHIFTAQEKQTGILFSRLVGLVLDSMNLYNSAIQEITTRERITLLLQESEERYRQIVENANDLIYRTDVDGCVTYINPISLHLSGIDQVDSILGRNYLEFVAPEWRTRVRRFYVHQYLSAIPNTYFEFPIITSDGHELWLGQNVQVIRDAELTVGFQAVARDITAIKRAQEALSIARDQAQEASHFKSELLAKVGHELRTPLAGIMGYAELLRDHAFGPLSQDQKRIVETIIDSSEYLSSIINELMDQAQIDAKKLVLEFSQCSPADLLHDMEEMMAVLAQERGLSLRTSLDPDVPATIVSDAQRLKQILINLVANAVKFTGQGEICVRIFLPDPAHWAMQVADTGMGIPAKAQATIFDPFWKVSNSITRDNRGIGLGLSITKQLVDLLGGRIILESEAGKGSTFTIIFPNSKFPGD